ncbi:MAG: protein translocase subunit SecDF, partial [Patiriisocius sp.]
LFKNVNINFLAKRKIAYAISTVLILISIGSLVTNSLDQGVDFVGGRTYTVRFAQDVDATEVKKDLITQFKSAQAKTYGANNQLKITTKYKVGETGSEIDNEVQVKLYEGVKSYLPVGMTYDQFKDDNEAKVAGIMEY